MNPLPFHVLTLTLVIGLAQNCRADDEKQSAPNVFEIPRIQFQLARHNAVIQQLFKQKKYAEAEQQCLSAIKLVQHHAASHYNLACAQARQDKTDEAIASLAKAVELGFNDAKLMKEDEDLRPLRGRDEFPNLLATAEKTARPPTPWKYEVKSATAADGQVLVSSTNTSWDLKNGVFKSYFERTKAAEGTPIIKGHGEVGNLLRKWYEEGTAAGNVGDFYDNHDGDHSNMAYAQFPQLTRIEFSSDVKKYHFQTSLQNRFFYNQIVLGNSSTALTRGPFWRSQTRSAYTNSLNVAILAAQYQHNHIYVYPEHRDHDPGHNGDGGYGDVYPANTPYLITSQGSSGSDRVFLDTIACTLAAFRPDVKKFLAKNGALVPTVQMIFRASNQPVKSRDDYLTGKAHPTVFNGEQLNVMKMVRLAHEMTLDRVPPVIRLRVVEEEKAVVGRDYFEFAPREQLFDTPAAIARVMRSTKYRRRMVVSAESSHDLNKGDLKWHWVVLRGDDDRISIKPLDDRGSKAEMIVPYHARRPITEGAKMESNRVDIGVFADNGTYFSAPGFITWYSLDSEERTYNDKHLIQSVVYKTREDGGNYADPLVATAKSWRDEYRYDENDQLVGWTRHRGEMSEQFTAEGALVTKTDDQGRPLEAQTVVYAARRRDKKAPLLEQHLGTEILHYKYSSPSDQRGSISRREAAVGARSAQTHGR